MSIRALIFFGLVVASLAYSLPQPEREEEEEHGSYYVNPGWIDLEHNGEYFDLLPMVPPEAEGDAVLVRRVRSPQGRFDGRFTHSRRHGSSATFDYTYPINKNWEWYAQGQRNFKYHDTSAHGGLRFKF